MNGIWDFMKFVEFQRDIIRYLRKQMEAWKEFIEKWDENAVYGENQNLFYNLLYLKGDSLTFQEIGRIFRTSLELSAITTKYHSGGKYSKETMKEICEQLRELENELEEVLKNERREDLSVR